MMNISRSKQAEIEINESRQRLSELSAHLQSAKEQERTRIAREVHDDIGGNLTAIKIDLLWLINRLGNAGPADAREGAGHRGARRPHHGDHLAHRARPAPAAARAGAPRRHRVGGGRVPETHGDTVHRELRRARTSRSTRSWRARSSASSARPSPTSPSTPARPRSRCTSASGTARCSLSVTDNGRGIQNTDLLKAGSFGLRGMLERARNLGGEVSFKGARRGHDRHRAPAARSRAAAGRPAHENATDAP